LTQKLWGGRFVSEPSQLLRRLNDSFAFDRELWNEDVEGSIAWARAIADAGVLSEEELDLILGALVRIEAPADGDYEDVHSYVEAKLYELIGAGAGKLHTGRSRNDQVATDLKLWLKRACDEAIEIVNAFATTLATRALEEAATPMPGYTHSKQAEPVTFGHWCLAYVEMLRRDRARFASASERGDECPLGSGALAGTPLPVDRDALARSLGFARANANSIDGVSDRDFAAEYLFAASMTLTHLSMATGSSRMPQKKNPDVLELARGYAARGIGELTGFLALLKGLPLAYDKDLQLDKEPLFRTRRVIATLVPALRELISGLSLDRDRMRAAAGSDALIATAVADALAATGMPFREAHDQVSRNLANLGSLAKEHGVTLDGMLARKSAFGGTAPERVAAAAKTALLESAKS